MADLNAALFSEHSGHLRMVTTYWEMAAALVNHGAICMELFNETNSEHISVFSKIEPLLGEVRNAFGAQFLANLEKLIDAMPNGRSRTEAARQRANTIRAELASRRVQATA